MMVGGHVNVGPTVGGRSLLLLSTLKGYFGKHRVVFLLPASICTGRPLLPLGVAERLIRKSGITLKT